jgi:hypothetical protein
MHRRIRWPGKFGVAAFLAALAASAPPAAAAVTIGQLAPPGSPATCAGTSFDITQGTLTSGNTYVVPSTDGITAWTVTSWSHNATTGAGQTLTMKVFRPLGGVTHMVVGHDGPRNLTPSSLNTFPASVPGVKPGDLLGLHADPVANACTFFSPNPNSVLQRSGDLGDGQSGDFSPNTERRANITAVLAPTNTFTLGEATRNKKKGTATITANVPNPGELTGSGKAVTVAGAGGAVISKTVTAPGAVELTIRAKGKKKRKLNETGKVKVTPEVTYTPTGGDPSTQSRKLKLKKRKR